MCGFHLRNREAKRQLQVTWSGTELWNTGTPSLPVLRVVKYWFHILDLNRDRLLFKCYKFQHYKAERGQECWALTVKNILFSMGFGHVWITQGVANQQAFISLFKQRCTDVESNYNVLRNPSVLMLS